MEWFVCAVIGLNSKGSQSNGSYCFDWDDVVVDGFGTARINASASRLDSSLPHSPQSFSDGLKRLSQLFLDLIRQLNNSHCLPKRIEQHFRDNVITYILRHLINHLVSAGHVVPTCSPSQFDEIIRVFIQTYRNRIPNDLSLSDTLMHIIEDTYLLIHNSENEGLVNHPIRLTDKDFDVRSPQYTIFVQLLDPELVDVRKQFDSTLFDETAQISSWKEFLQKVADVEEVKNDTAFLKLPFFRPTLLSLQAKFQHLASSVDGSLCASTSSLLSSHSFPHASLEPPLDSSLRSLSSSSHVKDEFLHLLNFIHSLLASSLPPSLLERSQRNITDQRLAFLQPDHVNPLEKFRPSLFDEADDEKLARSLVRCLGVCRLIGAEKCIHNIPTFFDRTTSALHSSNSFLRTAAYFLFQDLIITSSAIPQLRRFWDRLHSAFRDGQLEEKFALILGLIGMV
ncbi:hypothetical protein BLNAU_14556 [Blattamonas nauphoetae]|uniref:Uncharacterized protein n=1 Tax=Blattamonas nauphoetae TaxID=2049346 RepID=A0ABQ9XIW2_9EUKA|nr:hypothetical protein BLNAU_14556 [Blattamonas nauphoetae]